MPKERLSMRKIKEVLRQHFECGHSRRRIADSCGIARSTVGDYLMRARAAGLSWSLPAEMDEERLEACLFPERSGRSKISRPLPDWNLIHEELRKKNVTLMQLWVEYKAEYPDGYQYSQFCRWYREWKQSVDPCLRQTYKAGERLFVDYCGQTVPVVNRETGECQKHANLHGGVGDVELHLCGNDVDATIAGLDRLACAGGGIFRRLSGTDYPG